jgi:hypothetical protein
MKLVNDWKSAWRWHSSQAMALAAALPLVWNELPTDLRDSIPQEWMPYITAGILLGGLIGRVRDQK